MTTDPIKLRTSLAEYDSDTFEERYLAQLEAELAMPGPEPFDRRAEWLRRSFQTGDSEGMLEYARERADARLRRRAARKGRA